jgi:hypothetical protein
VIKKSLRLIFGLMLQLVALQAMCQTYGNEWIDFNKSYFKIKVGQEGVYRIPSSVLQTAGIPSTISGAQFSMFRDGSEIPIYVSTNGVLSSNDYVEFLGRSANGKLDKELFENPSFQSDDRICLFTDTATYFLTFDNNTNHLRFAQTPNNIPTTLPLPTDFCLATIGNYFTNNFMPGRKVVPGFEIQASLFDNGEGYIDQKIASTNPVHYTIQAPNAVASNYSAQLNLSILRYSYDPMPLSFKISVNGNQLADSNIAADATKNLLLNFSSSLVGNSNDIGINPNGTSSSDVYGISFLELVYPRSFDVTGLNYFSFKLPINNSQQYLEFANFNNNNSAVKLYDLNNQKWYFGDLSVSGKTRFYIDALPTETAFVLFAENSLSIHSITSLQAVNFVDYGLKTNQGNYIIITHKNYEAITNGHNYIQDYKNYRSSISGGNYSVVVADVETLYDEFGYGYSMHPASIKKFLEYAYNNWSTTPSNVFFIGKGLLYEKIRSYLQNTSLYPYAGIVPTYGDIGSDIDFVNFLPQKKMSMNVGRISAWSPEEIGVYLQKVSDFESALGNTSTPTHETDFWKKQVLHIVGGKTVGEQDGLAQTMTNAAAIISDANFGAQVTTIKKNTTVPIDQINSQTIDSLVNSGLSLITFHGHATPNGFELNLNNPEQYNSIPRLPHFIGLGCDVAQVYNLNSNVRTISERFINAANGGSVSMIASNNLQFSDFHARYLPAFYSSLSKGNYGKTIGEHHRFVYDSLRKLSLLNPSTFDTDYYYFHLESLLLQGDPATKIFSPDFPDYHVANNSISSSPVNVNIAQDSFTLRIVAYNLGKALNNSVSLKVEHTNPSGNTSVVRKLSLANLYNSDTVLVNVVVDKVNDLGLNKYKVTIDDDNSFDELIESNNVAQLDLFIYSDNLVPVYPKEFSIVNQQPTLKSSTLNPFRSIARYKIEIDTTELFNSPSKQQTTISSIGGVIKWAPNLQYRDSTVYYWRASMDSLVNGNNQWSGSSFIYLNNGNEGWNQSHYYQYLKDGFTKLNVDNDRIFRFSKGNNIVSVSNAVYSEDGTTPWNTADFAKVMFNGTDVQRLGCQPWDGTIQIMVFDSATNSMWQNSPSGSSGAYPTCLINRNVYAFEFPVATKQGRDNAAHFLDSIPNGNYFMVRNLINLGAFTPSFVNDWKPDTLSAVPSLYKSLHSLGFSMIDSFTQKRVFIFFRKKGNNNYPVYQIMGNGLQDTLQREFVIQSFGKNGSMKSVVVGPALQWKEMKWRISAKDSIQHDFATVKVFGIDSNKNQVFLFETNSTDTTLNWIDAKQFRNLLLVLQSNDTTDLTSPQLDFWRVMYAPVPEAALNPAAYLNFKDSLQVGQMANLSVAVENLTNISMDSMLVRYRLIDANSITHLLSNVRYKKLVGNDTLHASISFDPKSYPGKNILFVEANPDNDQPEQYHPNNLGFVQLNIGVDQTNPLLDVTFDGRHILDRDIVSSKPFIQIVLRDENKYLKLDDTSLLSLKIKYPNDITASRNIWFDGVTTKFIPATGNKNEAIIEYKPNFSEDGIYELSVTGKDKTGNTSGTNAYKTSFNVVSKSTITNVFNYPNPFSTSTAFVFTLTGSEIPTQFKIQILSVTGKVVREITKEELGPIYIGRNITEYKWDGKDQYGQLLGNGVYFYRVVTSINGHGLEHRADFESNSTGNNTDRFFKNGYGKMYIVR